MAMIMFETKAALHFLSGANVEGGGKGLRKTKALNVSLDYFFFLTKV